jgi:hypothetical protein
MSNHRDRRSPLRTASVSLVAVIACALASDARGGQPPAEPSIGEQTLSARVRAIAERIRSVEPALARELPPGAKIAQWRN